MKQFLYLNAFKLGIENEKTYIAFAETIPGWVTAVELAEKFAVSASLPPNAIIVEVGAFLGRSTVVTAGARKKIGSGIVHAIDPFDASGDDFSVPVYQKIENALSTTLLGQFKANLKQARLDEQVRIHVGTAESVVREWAQEIDMLVLDGDQSPEGARQAYDLWIPFLKRGGSLIVHNSAERSYEHGHDGHRRVVVESVVEPDFTDVRCVRMTTFARKSLS